MSLWDHKIRLCTVSTRRRFKDNLQGDSQMLLKRRLRPDPHAANAKVRNPREGESHGSNHPKQ
jgi:hypothetical protein